MTSDQQYMNRCIELAQLGQESVMPNPMVGSVVVYNGKIIGEGYHEKYGESHAEVNAINSVEDKSLLSQSTIFVSLEPCSHFGNTPPCCNMLKELKFKRVVIGCQDPNKEVFGKGIQSLIDSNIEVTVGVLENECRELNKVFFTFHEKQRPFITLKWAQSQDGYIDKSGEQVQISCNETQSLVHQWRSDHHAILVGRRTVEVDNPRLDVRAVEGHNPIRIVLDSKAQLSNKLNVFSHPGKTIVLNENLDKSKANIEYHGVGKMNIDNILSKLYSLGIQSVLVEGGRETIKSFIDYDVWDNACVISGNIILENGTKAPDLTGTAVGEEKFFADTVTYYENR